MSFKLFKDKNNFEDDFYERYDEDASFKMPIEDLFEEIKSGRKKFISGDDYLTIDDFFEKDNEGKTLLEYIYLKKLEFRDYSLQRKLFNDIKVIEYCLKDKNLLLNVLVKDRILYPAITTETLFEKLSIGMSLIEYLIKNNILGLYVLNGINDIRVYELLKKYNRLEAVEYLNEELLFRPCDKYPTLFEYLLEQNRVTVNMISHFRLHTEVCELCRKYNKIYLLKHARSNFLLYEYKDGSTVIDHLIKGNNADRETFYFLGNKESNNIIYSIIKNKSYRYLVYYPQLLLNKVYNNPSKTHLDLILENYNKSVDMYLADINIRNMSMMDRAKLYIKCSDYGVIAFLPRLNIDRLLSRENNVKFIEALLRTDKEKTISQVLTPELRRNIEVASILKMYGVKIDDIKVPTDKVDEFYDKKQELLKSKIPSEIDSKLLELQSLFAKDGISSKEEIDTLIASYKSLALRKYKYLNRELDLLIEYKKKYKGFVIVRTEAKPFFNPTNQSVNINNSNIGIFNHELGHALHYIGASSGEPQNLNDVLMRIRFDERCLDRIKVFSDRFEKLIKSVDKEAKSIYEKRYAHYFDNKRESISELISLESDKLVKRFEEIGYNAKDIQKAVSELCNIDDEEYIKRFKEAKINSIADSIVKERYNSLGTICDILDAIYVGRLRDDMCETSKGTSVSVSFGHGINYYNKSESIFNEMMADYLEIIKDTYSEEALNCLRGIVGDELIDLLGNFYEQKVLHIEPQLVSEEMITYGR